ncbi:MAG: hypothetical protein RML72_05010, partial [Bacteroidia bacterium]|nr:hypothetical protein [Bacteroidia bacterium]
MKQLSVFFLFILCSSWAVAQGNFIYSDEVFQPQEENVVVSGPLLPSPWKSNMSSHLYALPLDEKNYLHKAPIKLEKFRKAALEAEKNGKSKPIKKNSLRPFSGAAYDTLIDGHIARCVFLLNEQEEPDSIFGYITGTIGQIPLQSGRKAYISMHGVNVQVPRPRRLPYEGRVKAVRLGLGSVKTQIVDEPDSFYVNVFNITAQNQLRFLGRQGFTLEKYIDAIRGGEVIEIPFEDTVPVSGNMLFAVETNIPERYTNDTITFQYTFHILPRICGPTRWFIFVNEEGTNQPIAVTRIGNLIGDTTLFGNPYIVPVIEYYPANSAIRVFDEHIEVCRNNQRFYPRSNP